jgi:hypothetical protein
MPDIHHLAGMLLMTMNLPQAFIALRNLLNRPCLRAFYSGVTEEVEAYYRVSSMDKVFSSIDLKYRPPDL